MRLPPLTAAGWLRWHIIQPHLREIPEGSRLVEVGCGVGGYATRFDRKFEYVGYEADGRSAAVAATRVREGAVRPFPLPEVPEYTCDALVAFEVLEHIEDDVGALKQWRRWIRPGGKLLLSTPGNPRRFGPWDRRAGHFRRYEPDVLEDMLEQAGYRDITVRWYGAPLLYVGEFIRNRLAGEPAADMASLTKVSARQLQPTHAWGWATWLGTLPFRYLQIPLSRAGLGVGLIAAAKA